MADAAAGKIDPIGLAGLGFIARSFAPFSVGPHEPSYRFSAANILGHTLGWLIECGAPNQTQWLLACGTCVLAFEDRHFVTVAVKEGCPWATFENPLGRRVFHLASFDGCDAEICAPSDGETPSPDLPTGRVLVPLVEWAEKHADLCMP